MGLILPVCMIRVRQTRSDRHPLLTGVAHSLAAWLAKEPVLYPNLFHSFHHQRGRLPSRS